MPGLTTSTDNHKNSHSPTVSFKMGRQEVNDLGVQYLQEIGSGYICVGASCHKYTLNLLKSPENSGE